MQQWKEPRLWAGTKAVSQGQESCGDSEAREESEPHFGPHSLSAGFLAPFNLHNSPCTGAAAEPCHSHLPPGTVSPTVQQDPSVSPGFCSCQWLPARVACKCRSLGMPLLSSALTGQWGAQSCVIHSTISMMCLWEQRANSGERGDREADPFLSSSATSMSPPSSAS